MRTLVAAIVLCLLTPSAYTQEAKKSLLPEGWKLSANDVIKPNPAVPRSSPPSPAPTQGTKKEILPEGWKLGADDVVRPGSAVPRSSPPSTASRPVGSWARENTGNILVGVIFFMISGALLVGLKHGDKHERREPGRRDVLVFLVVIGMLVGLGVFQAVLRPAALGTGAGMVVGVLVDQVRNLILKGLD